MKNFKPLYTATKLSNYVKDDKICDFLDILEKNNYYVTDDLQITKKRNIDKSILAKTSTDYIMESGIMFEKEIIDKIIEKMTINGEIDKLCKETKINPINIKYHSSGTRGYGKVLEKMDGNKYRLYPQLIPVFNKYF